MRCHFDDRDRDDRDNDDNHDDVDLNDDDDDNDDNHDDDDDDLYVGHSFQQWAAHADQSPYPKAPNMVIS